MQAIQSGSVQMLVSATSKFTVVAPQVQVLDLPFMFDSYEDISEVTAPETEVGQRERDTGIFAVFSAPSEEQFLAWGWRLPFLLSIVLLGVGPYHF
jgi:hypothetical protein